MMPKKIKRKVAAFKTFCRNQVKSGLINQADGTWRPVNTSKTMDRDMVAGYRMG